MIWNKYLYSSHCDNINVGTLIQRRKIMYKIITNKTKLGKNFIDEYLVRCKND